MGDHGAHVLTSRQPGEPITGYWIDVTCRSCGSPVAHEAAGTPGTTTQAIARCTRCNRPWRIRVELIDEHRQINGPGPAAAARRAEAMRNRPRRQRREPA